jgi:hypothetical protein
MSFLVFFPTVDLHFSLKRSRVLEVEVRLNFFLVRRTSLDSTPTRASLKEFLSYFESENRPEIFLQVGIRTPPNRDYSYLIVTLLLSSV